MAYWDDSHRDDDEDTEHNPTWQHWLDLLLLVALVWGMIGLLIVMEGMGR